MEIYNTSYNESKNEIDQFYEKENPHESFEKIKNLFAEMGDKEQEDILLSIETKVMSHISKAEGNYSISKVEESVLEWIKSCKEEAWSKSIKIENQQKNDEYVMSSEDKEILNIFINQGNPEEDLKKLEHLLSKYQGDLDKITHNKLPISLFVVLKGDPNLAKLILPHLNRLDLPNINSNALFYSCSYGNLEITNLLLNLYVEKKLPWGDEESQAQNIISLLLNMPNVSAENKIEFVKFIIKNGYDLDRHPNVNPLSIAISLNDQKLVDFFINEELKINLDSADNKVGTPLFQALSQKNYKVLELLLKRGADTSISCCKIDSMDVPPVVFAIEKGDLIALDLLGQYKASFPFRIEHDSKNSSMSVLSIVKIIRGDNYKEKIEILKKYYPTLKEVSDKEIKTLNISHSHSLKGIKLISRKDSDETFLLNLEGLPAGFKNYKILAKGVKEFSEKIDDKAETNIPLESYKETEEALLFTSKKPTPQELYDRFHSGKWTLLATGMQGHDVSIIIKKDPEGKEPSKLIICNRGLAKTLAIDSFSFDEKKLTPKIIELLTIELKKQPEKMYKAYIFERLKEQLNFQKKLEDQLLNIFCSLEDQTVGNCTYASPEMASKVILMLDAFKMKRIQGNRIFSEGHDFSSKINEEFEDLRCLTRIQNIHDYIDLHEQENFPYILDIDLLKEALLVVKNGTSKNPMIKKEIENIEMRIQPYLKLGNSNIIQNLFNKSTYLFSYLFKKKDN